MRFFGCMKMIIFKALAQAQARVCMKFKTYVNKIIIYHQKMFDKDWCIYALAKVVNARAHVSSRLRALTPFARASMNPSAWKIFWWSIIILLTEIFNFVKIRTFVSVNDLELEILWFLKPKKNAIISGK